MRHAHWGVARGSDALRVRASNPSHSFLGILLDTCQAFFYTEMRSSAPHLFFSADCSSLPASRPSRSCVFEGVFFFADRDTFPHRFHQEFSRHFATNSCILSRSTHHQAITWRAGRKPCNPIVCCHRLRRKNGAERSPCGARHDAAEHARHAPEAGSCGTKVKRCCSS